MERAARAFGFALGVELVGDGEHLGIELDDAVERRAGFIDLGDPREIPIGQATRREFARPHALLQFRNGDFIEFKRRHTAGRIIRIGMSRMRECGKGQGRSADFQAG